MKGVRKLTNLWSTGQIAKLTGLNSKTVRMWIDDGLLPGLRLPGREGLATERRVQSKVLRKFLVKHGYTEIAAKMDAMLANGVAKEG